MHVGPRAVGLVSAVLVAAACGKPRLVAEREQSATSGKPLVVEFHADWCQPCKRFEHDVLPDPRVQLSLSGVMFTRYDFDSAVGRHAAARYGVRGVPTFLVIRVDGTVVGGIKAAPSVGRFVAFLDWAQLTTADPDTLARRLAADRSPQTRIIAARWHASRGDFDRARALFDEAIALAGPDTHVRDAVDWDRTQLDAAGQTADVLARAAAAYVRAHPRAAQTLLALRVALLGGGLGADERRMLAATQIAAAANDGLLLNALVFVLLAADDPALAVAAARRQVELAGDDANPYDTLAEALHAQGDTAGALAASDRAIARASSKRDRRAFEANRDRFRRADRLPGPNVADVRAEVERIMAGLHIAPATQP